jgi:hypothetical protein
MQKGINMKQYPLSAGYKEEGTSKSAAELIDAGVKTIREQVFYVMKLSIIIQTTVYLQNLK